MRALITGASSGIGRDIAKALAKEGYDLIIVARNVDKLNKLEASLKATGVSIQVVQMDLNSEENCRNLHKQFKNQVDLLVNNAGLGVFGKFENTDLDKELQLINTNIMSLHILTKLFLQDMKVSNNGQILNVASIAGYMPGPLMSAYYASKAYVVRLSQGIKEELRRDKSNVKISVLCPGPVNTNFNNVANFKFSARPLTSEYVAKYTIKKLKKNRFYIVPGFSIRCLRHFAKIVPDNVISRFVYVMQKNKNK
ncbi:MAG: SDR family oxidoreductase [Clostridia bacterium]|nr:SDR family oxidoreductase [Clostridia bacterium]